VTLILEFALQIFQRLRHRAGSDCQPLAERHCLRRPRVGLFDPAVLFDVSCLLSASLDALNYLA
jgi:hypothetical protein